MAANLIGFLAVALSIVAFAVTYRYVRPQPAQARLKLLAISALLAIPAILFAVYYLHLLPEWMWFYTLRAFPGSEFLIIFLGCAGGCAASLMPRFLLAFPLFGVILLGVVPFLKPLLGPIPDEVFRERWEGDSCLQSTSSTCGPASVASILKFYGMDSSERDIARAAHSYVGGTEAWYLARYLQSRGLRVRFIFMRTFVPRLGLPAMVGVRIGGMGHFIAVLGIEGDQVIFVDPLSGKRKVPLAEFRQLYDFTGFHMVVNRDRQ